MLGERDCYRPEVKRGGFGEILPEGMIVPRSFRPIVIFRRTAWYIIVPKIESLQWECKACHIPCRGGGLATYLREYDVSFLDWCKYRRFSFKSHIVWKNEVFLILKSNNSSLLIVYFVGHLVCLCYPLWHDQIAMWQTWIIDVRRDSMINFLLRWHKLSFLIGIRGILPRNKYVILIPRLSGANTSLTRVNVLFKTWAAVFYPACPHPYFNDNRQLTIRLILTIIIYLEATQLKRKFDVMCAFT
jgi:hypothetical protein